MAWDLHPHRLCYTFITAQTIHMSPPATLAARCNSNNRAPAETHSSCCLHAAIASTGNLIGGIPRPLEEISIAIVRPSKSTYEATSLYDHSDCSD